jgi:hypothetical protein
MTVFKRLVLLLFVSTLIGACYQSGSDDADQSINADDTASLAGTYDLVSITSKSDEIWGIGTVIVAGQTNTFEVPFDGGSLPVTLQISGTVTFTATGFSTNFPNTISLFGETQSEVTQESGSYSVSNSKMTTVSDDPEDRFIGSSTFGLSASGKDLTLDDSIATLLLRKR